jgi:hypothetical protein
VEQDFLFHVVGSLCKAIQDRRHGMLTSSIVLLHGNVRLHTAAHTQALLQHFNWELFDQPPYSPDVALSDYHLLTYCKNWMGSQHFSSNEKLMEGVKMWVSSQVADKNLFPSTTSASIPAMNMLRSSLSMYIFFVYNTIFVCSRCLFC